MHPPKHTFPALLLLTSLVSACGKSNPHLQTDLEQGPVTGALTPLIESFAEKGRLSACDQKHLPKMLEIARAIDQHRNEIDSYKPDAPTTKDYRYVQVGPMIVTEILKPEVPKEGWQFETRGWQTIIENYNKVLKNPTQRNWAYINHHARGTLANDNFRILKGYAYAIGYLDQPLIQSLKDSIEKCMDDSKCKSPEFSELGLKWLKKQYDYNEYLSKIKEATDASDVKKTLKLFADDLAYDLTRYIPKKNSGVSRNGTTLNLPIEAGVFSEATQKISNFVESIWKSDSLSVKIDWKPRIADPFTLLLSETSGGRSGVNSLKKTVVLNNGDNNKVLAHEFGHVLGFTDHYFDVWDESHCWYEVQSRDDDLMSNHNTGLVTAEEWETLKSLYPL